MDEAKIKDILREENEEFRRLEEKHHQYEVELSSFANLALLTPENQVKKKELKKKKLLVKDKMYELIISYEREHKGACL